MSIKQNCHFFQNTPHDIQFVQSAVQFLPLKRVRIVSLFGRLFLKNVIASNEVHMKKIRHPIRGSVSTATKALVATRRWQMGHFILLLEKNCIPTFKIILSGSRIIMCHGPLTRYVKLLVSHARDYRANNALTLASVVHHQAWSPLCIPVMHLRKLKTCLIPPHHKGMWQTAKLMFHKHNGSHACDHKNTINEHCMGALMSADRLN